MRKFWKKLDPVLMMVSSFVIILSVIILSLSLFERLFPNGGTGSEAEVARLFKLLLQIALVVFFFIAIYMVFILLNIQAILEKNA